MKCFRNAILVIACVSIGYAALGQQQSFRASTPEIDNAFVQKQFGPSCSLIGMAPVIADMDGDGVDDAVIPARCTNPMIDQAQFTFRVIDPYYSFFGYGNPKVTLMYSTQEPERRGFVLLMIHGSGPEAWRSTTPKAKFVIVNLPFKDISVKRLAVRKKTVMGVYIEETGGDQLVSVVYFDGKKYKYQPMGSTLE